MRIRRQLRVRVTRFHQADRYGVVTPSPRISAGVESWEGSRERARGYDEEAAAADITEQITRLVPCRWGSFNCPNWYRVALRVDPSSRTGVPTPLRCVISRHAAKQATKFAISTMPSPSGEKEVKRIFKKYPIRYLIYANYIIYFYYNSRVPSKCGSAERSNFKLHCAQILRAAALIPKHSVKYSLASSVLRVTVKVPGCGGKKSRKVCKNVTCLSALSFFREPRSPGTICYSNIYVSETGPSWGLPVGLV